MTSHSLPSQAFRPAQPLGEGPAEELGTHVLLHLAQ